MGRDCGGIADIAAQEGSGNREEEGGKDIPCYSGHYTLLGAISAQLLCRTRSGTPGSIRSPPYFGIIWEISDKYLDITILWDIGLKFLELKTIRTNFCQKYSHISEISTEISDWLTYLFCRLIAVQPLGSSLPLWVTKLLLQCHWQQCSSNQSNQLGLIFSLCFYSPAQHPQELWLASYFVM